MKSIKIKNISIAPRQQYVYDPCCTEPHSYISNGFVSHNCVVLIDEVEKAFTTQLDSGVTSNLLGSLLWWLQEHTTRVFTIMTTNNKDTIPKELYREGRIDDIMVFKGLENIKDATDFSSQVLGSLFAKLELEEDTMQEIKKCLQSRLQVLFAMGKAVPQVTVIKEVNTIVKQVISKG